MVKNLFMAPQTYFARLMFPLIFLEFKNNQNATEIAKKITDFYS